MDTPNETTVGEPFKLTIEKKQTDISSSVIQFPPGVKVDLAEMENHRFAEILYASEANQLSIDWTAEDETATVRMNLTITSEGDMEIYSRHFSSEEISFSRSLYLTAKAASDESEELIEENEKAPPDPEYEAEDIEEDDEAEEQIVQTEDENQFANKEKGTVEEVAPTPEPDSEEDIEKPNEPNEQLAQDSQSIEEELAENEVEESPPKPDRSVGIAAANIITVRNWDSFVAELRNPQIEEIHVLENLSAPIQSPQQFVVNSNKKIVGFGTTIDFRKTRINISSSTLTVENLLIRAEQSELDAEASVFYSNHANAVLHLVNSSFDGVQSAQSAHLMNGHIRISGAVRFEIRNAFEIFEAKNITFEENASFVGSATGPIAGARKEVLNLYNSPQVTIRRNANVRLLTNSKNSLIAVKDGSAASINILETGKLEVIAGAMGAALGDPLLNLSGASTVSVGQNAMLDIQNLREGNTPGGLLNMTGQVALGGRSKVAFWDKGANVTIPSGDNYRYFPNVIDGRLFLSNNRIITGLANTPTSRSVSSNPGKNGRTFTDTFTNRDTADMKRLLITPPERPKKPIIYPMNDRETVISGQAAPGVTVKIIDKSNNKTWLTTANPTTGLFSAALTPYAPYKSGSVLYAVAIDAYADESEEASTTVTDALLTLSIPNTMPFEVTPIGFDEVLIPRHLPAWTMKVRDTRGQGSRWRITAKAAAPLRTASGEMLPSDALIFKKGKEEQFLRDGVLIEEGTTGTGNETTIQWHEEEGIFIKLNPIEAGVLPNQTYTTTVQWTIENAP